LGHIVGKVGVRVDPKNIEAMQDWPCPNTLKILRGFMGLTRYYRKFVKNYGNIVAPLTTDHFHFLTLKETTCTTPVLTLTDFTNTFVLECDASRRGIGVVLVQVGQPLAFTNKQLLERNLGQSIYENEMLAILHAVDICHLYLLGQRFQIKTDHQSLNYFLEKCPSSSEQQK
jgi:hypothetical protein